MPVDSVRSPESSTLRLADLLAALSLETDLGMGHPPEEAMRTCLLATGLARQLAQPDAVVADIYWTSLLMHVGCTAFAHEQAALFGGDEIAVNAIGSRTDFTRPREAMAFLAELTRSMPALQRARVFFAGTVLGARFGSKLAAATCEVAAGMGRRLALSAGVQIALLDLFERWDGKGDPRRLAGDAIALPARFAQLAAQATVFTRLGGAELALEVVDSRAGGALDPDLSRAFRSHGRELIEEIERGDPWLNVLEAEPEPRLRIPPSQLSEVARAFGDAVDLKSVYTPGHSMGVAELAARAGAIVGLSDDDVTCLRLAGYLHDIGRVGVANGIWEKEGSLTAAEWEQVRLHPYHTERILSRASALREVASIAGKHHERLDGSGYHRQASAPSLPITARILAVADACQAMGQRRPHRAALSAAPCADNLAAEARNGRLDRNAVEAVLAAAGARPDHVPAPRLPGGLTERELDVLRLLASGLTNKQMGRKLFISPKTIGRHVEHIYLKLGVSTRAAATMFAAEHGLLGNDVEMG